MVSTFFFFLVNIILIRFILYTSYNIKRTYFNIKIVFNDINVPRVLQSWGEKYGFKHNQTVILFETINYILSGSYVK